MKVLILPKKNADFLQQNADISKMKKALVINGIFSETMYVFAYLQTEFQGSVIILTSFR